MRSAAKIAKLRPIGKNLRLLMKFLRLINLLHFCPWITMRSILSYYHASIQLQVLSYWTCIGKTCILVRERCSLTCVFILTDRWPKSNHLQRPSASCASELNHNYLSI
uniref:Uncharacterized protein LOC108039164 n=1 Tax=Drosophila rhopaloa TaxID=1041015 RepID=A0A6P4E8L4_DRORH